MLPQNKPDRIRILFDDRTWACGNSSTITLTSAERRDGRTLGTRC